MYCTDFIFDGIKASDQGFCIVSFDSIQDTVYAGSKIDFTTIVSGGNKKWLKTNSAYSEPLSFNFSIAKINCNEEDTIYLTGEDISFIMRWLVRNEYCTINFLQEDFEEVSYNCRLQLQERFSGGKAIGFDIEGIADAPFGYGSEIKIVLPDGNYNQSIYDPSDEIGETYPYMEMKCIHNGTISIENIDMGQITQIKNCTANEIITIDQNFQIASNLPSHSSLPSDFNYSYFCFGNTFLNRVTKVKVTNCITTIRFKPIRKGVC